MFPGLGCLDYPFFAEPGRKWNVDRVNVIASKQALVTSNGLWWRRKWCLGLAFRNKLRSFSSIAARNCNNLTISRIMDCLPIFAGNSSSAENAPPAKCFGAHKIVFGLELSKFTQLHLAPFIGRLVARKDDFERFVGFLQARQRHRLPLLQRIKKGIKLNLVRMIRNIA